MAALINSGISICVMNLVLVVSKSSALSCIYSNMNNKSVIELCTTPFFPVECYSLVECEDPTPMCYISSAFTPDNNTFNLFSGCTSMDNCLAEKGSLSDCTLTGMTFHLLLNFEYNCATCCDSSFRCNVLVDFPVPLLSFQTTASLKSPSLPTAVMIQDEETIDGANAMPAETSTHLRCFYGNLNNASLLQRCMTTEPPPNCFTFQQCEDPTHICYTYGNLTPTTGTFKYFSGCLPKEDCQALKGSLHDCAIFGFGLALLFNTGHYCSQCCDDSYCNDLGVLNVPNLSETTPSLMISLPTTEMMQDEETTIGATSVTELSETTALLMTSLPTTATLQDEETTIGATSVTELSETTALLMTSLPATATVQDEETAIGASLVTDVTSLTNQALEVTMRDISAAASGTTLKRESSSSGFASTDTHNHVYPSHSPEGNTPEHNSTNSPENTSQRTRQQSASTSAIYSTSANTDSLLKSSPTVEFALKATTGVAPARVSTISSKSPSTSGVFSSETSTTSLSMVSSSPTHRGYHGQSETASNGYSYGSRGLTKAYSTLSTSKDGLSTTYSTHSIGMPDETVSKTMDALSTSLSFSEIISTRQKEGKDHTSEILRSDVTTKHMEEVPNGPSLYVECLEHSLWNLPLLRNTLKFKFDFDFKAMVGRGVSNFNARSPKQEKHRFTCGKAHGFK